MVSPLLMVWGALLGIVGSVRNGGSSAADIAYSAASGAVVMSLAALALTELTTTTENIDFVLASILSLAAPYVIQEVKTAVPRIVGFTMKRFGQG